MPCARMNRVTLARSIVSVSVRQTNGPPPPDHALELPRQLRPISIRRISFVPAPIVYSFASRSSRPAVFSLT